MAGSTDRVRPEPRAARPYMPGYGITGPGEGVGLLPWAWAEERLRASRDYWVATARAGEALPHLMPVWGVWDGAALWFSSAVRSRKILDLRGNPPVAVSTDDAENPVVLNGPAEVVTGPADRRRFIEALNAKYRTDYGAGFTDPARTATVRVRPRWAFGLEQGEFATSPTRWNFG